MDLMLILDGNKDNLLQDHSLEDSDIVDIKLDEKRLSNPKYMLRILKSQKFDKVYYGCVNLRLIRFVPLVMMYIFLSGIRNGEIIDETGRKIKYSSIRLFSVILPKLLLEIVLSAFVVLYFYIKLPITRLMLRSSN